MKKGCAIGCLGFVVLFGLLITLVTVGTSGVSEGADDFLSLLQTGQYERAYMAMAPEYRNENEIDVFMAKVQQLGFDRGEISFWNNRTMKNNTGWVQGELSLPDGNRTIRVNLVYQNEKWLVRDFGLPEQMAKKAAVEEPRPRQTNSNSTTPHLPTVEEAKALARVTLFSFYEGRRKGDFTEFLKKSHPEFQRQYPLEKFNKIFRQVPPLLPALVEEKKMYLDKKPYGKARTLKFTGWIVLDFRWIHFRLGYLYHQNKWKPAYIFLNWQHIGQIFTDYLQKGKEKEAYNLVTSEKFRQQVSYREFLIKMKNFGFLHDKGKIKWNPPAKAEKFTFTGSLQRKEKGPMMKFAILLEREGEEWKVRDVRRR